ncbi:hypothetical protein POJ06DRAFT_134732 [Lipomyces tetrasporus]|uniref:PH domain-containing protein n=1 Tax=Lipomyces tetrasporus TaxID=54092 RepID=A0AAD7QQ49_9ASCO|nr:uncharacterized protein POJ06DRAFT_134732 [Lipomyces tetrasporus]KAJ8099424.1 hypothetical protein POJ06DRAFT_134732 [Lipomyces tetrasporus]
MDIAAGAVAPSGAGVQPKSSRPLVRSNSFQLHTEHSTTGSDGTSPTATMSENEQAQRTRRASSGSSLNMNTEQSAPRKLSTSSSVSFSNRISSKRNSIRAFFGKSSISASSSSATSPACVPPASSVTSNGASTPQANYSPLPPIDFTTADAAHHSYYKKLPYSTAILQAVAVDTLACNAHGSLFTIVSKSSLERRTFVLLPRAIIRYALNASSTSLPEHVLILSSESVAYASDDIPGRQYVLRVSERPERHQVEEQTLAQVAPDEDIQGPKKSSTSPVTAGSSARRSIFFHTNISTPTLWHPHHHDSSHHNRNHRHHYHHHHHHHHIPLLRDEKTRTVLLVFDTAAEFMRWMTLARGQIKSQRDSLENKRYDLFQSVTHEFEEGDSLEPSPPLFSDSYSISCPWSTPTPSATALTSSLPPSKRPSVISISASITSQASQRLSPLSGARQNSSSSVQTMGSLASSNSSSSLKSLQESVNPIPIRPRPPPAARRESATFSALTRLTSLRRTASRQRQRSPADSPSNTLNESALVDDDDGISTLSRSLGTNVRRKNKTKMTRRSPAGPPPSGPLPLIPTEQN